MNHRNLAQLSPTCPGLLAPGRRPPDRAGLGFALLDDPDLDGPEEVLVARLPPGVEPMGERLGPPV